MIEDILIEPVVGDFDVAEVEQQLSTIPFVMRDRVVTNKFMLAEDRETLEEVMADRAAGNTSFPLSLSLVKVNPKKIGVYVRSHTGSARAFVEWLRSRYKVRFLDEESNDVSAFVNEGPDGLDFLFGPPES